ncbi:MAG TPA: MaoC family dehydratase N-terminal domain-containing protein [Anaeromyxobacteraceae bacterium]|nr:MaoC family dehydratase N-terminal domain-containing protein [Anaeromyxobacteraceae bacterium]
MSIDPRHVGRRYGPYRNTVCAEQIRAFAVAVAGGVPGYFASAPGNPHPWSVDDEAARSSPHGALVAPPTFGVTFAMKPFAEACSDPELGIDLVRLLHAEQEFEHGPPVRPGDVLTTEGEIVEIRSKSSLSFLVVRTETVNDRGERVLVGRWTAVVRG